MPRAYVVEVDETKPAVRLIEANNTAAAIAFVVQGLVTVRLATQTDMYDMAKRGIEREDANAPDKAGEAQQAGERG